MVGPMSDESALAVILILAALVALLSGAHP